MRTNRDGGEFRIRHRQTASTASTFVGADALAAWSDDCTLNKLFPVRGVRNLESVFEGTAGNNDTATVNIWGIQSRAAPDSPLQDADLLLLLALTYGQKTATGYSVVSGTRETTNTTVIRAVDTLSITTQNTAAAIYDSANDRVARLLFDPQSYGFVWVQLVSADVGVTRWDAWLRRVG